MKVTTKTRFGYAWTNQPEQTPTGLIIPQPTTPSYKNLGWKQLKELRQKAARLNNSNFWSETVFVGNKAVAGIHVHTVASDILGDLERSGDAEVNLRDCP